jgi:hypothetical protein
MDPAAVVWGAGLRARVHGAYGGERVSDKENKYAFWMLIVLAFLIAESASFSLVRWVVGA